MPNKHPYFIVDHYSDTITLPPNPDWKISWTNGSRNNAILNLQYPSSRNIYLEAFLNNSTLPNSSPILSGYPIFFTGSNSIISAPLHTIDIDGDSLSGAMVQPLDYNGLPIPYNSGYSLSQPFGAGSFTQLDIPNNTLKTYSTNTGKFTIATKISDYRNGVLVGSFSRDWTNIVMSATNPKAPYPAPGTTFKRTTCPGQPTSYTYTFVDSTATDSVYLTLTPPSNGINYTITSTPGIGSATATISWITPSAWTIANNPYFFIKAFAHDNHCPLNGYSSYNILVHTVQCNSDTVWAGDANADYNVNLYDPLAIAVAYGGSGPVRTNASLAWTPQWCADWSDSTGTGVNYKHADCNGNGVVDNNDLAAVSLNYGLAHPKQSPPPPSKQAGLPDLFFRSTGANAFSGTTLYIPLDLGTPGSSMPNVYGIAARVRIQGIVPDTMGMTYCISSFGTSSNTLQFSRNISPNQVDWAYARTTHSAINSDGELAALYFNIPELTPFGTQIVLTLEDVRLINASGVELTGYNVLSDTITVNPLGIPNTNASVANVFVAPNPTRGQGTLHFNLALPTDVSITITDVTGRSVWHQSLFQTSKGLQQVLLPTGLAPGIYTIRIKGREGINAVRWTCE